MAACSQCGKPALFATAAGPLCLGCNERFQALIHQQINALIDEQNAAIQGINVTMGMDFPLRPRLQPPPAKVTNVNAPIIKISNSVVGAVNTGKVERLQVTLGKINQAGAKQLSEVVKAFAEAALADKALDEKMKGDLMEQINYLLEAARTPKKDRNGGVIKSVLETVGKVISVSGGLLKLWERLKGGFESLA